MINRCGWPLSRANTVFGAMFWYQPPAGKLIRSNSTDGSEAALGRVMALRVRPGRRSSFSAATCTTSEHSLGTESCAIDLYLVEESTRCAGV